MAEPSLDQIGQWIIDNKDKAGSPDFVKMSDAYRQMSGAQPASATTPAADGSNLPDITDVLKARNAADPYNADATMHRIVTGTATAIPDTVIAIGNAMQRFRGEPEAPYLGPKMLEAGGGVPLPSDASWTRQISEGGASALLGGGANAIRAAVQRAPGWISSIMPAATTFAKTTVAPTVASNAGGQVGGALGGETGALLGSLIGGAAPGAPGAVKSAIYSHYAGQGKPNAPEIALQAERQGIPTTAGMLGNEGVQHVERGLAGKPGAVNFINNRRQGSINAVQDAINRVADARGSIDHEPSPFSIGQNVTDTARTAAQDLRTRIGGEQQGLEDRVGFHTEVPVIDIIHAAHAQMPGLSVPGRDAIGYRINEHLSPLITRDAAGQPILTANGSPTVKYGLLRQWRTDLGRSFDQGRYPPATQQLYGPATAALRDAAAQRGIPPHEFDAIQARTQAAVGEQQHPAQPNAPALEQVAGREPAAAFSYLQGGANNPDRLRMLDAAGGHGMSQTFGDWLRMIGNKTLGKGDARGPINFADQVSAPRMDPGALDVIAGPHAPDVRDIAGVARAINYPTSQTGLTRAVGSQGDSLVNKLIGSEAFGKVGQMLGVGETAGRIVGLGAVPAFHNLRARILQSQTARDALASRPPAPGQTYSMDQLRAALIAANAGRQAGQ
jgi:hypothetical protein